MKLTFADYVKMDSRLAELLLEAQAINKRITSSPKGNSYRVADAWYRRTGGLRAKLKLLVGYERPAGPEALRSSHAYGCCYSTIYRALSDRDHADDWLGHA
jgi:hypothetical protein